MLELSGVTKSFGAVRALQNASLKLRPGEIRAFLGANGSGKSTMVKILSGLAQMDSGSMRCDGNAARIASPRDARRLGVVAAYQDLSLIPRMSIADNIALGREAMGFGGLVRRKAVAKETRALLDELGCDADPSALVSDLPSSEQCLVEIAKALSWKPRFLLLDEMTASLHKEQVERLFALLRRLAAGGLGLLFVTHRLDEVFSLCGAATILRGGVTVAETGLAGVSEADLVYYMTGTRIDSAECRDPVPRVAATGGETPVLEVFGLSSPPKLRGVDLSLLPGEIVGIAGLQGQGQSEFLRAVYGHRRYQGGRILVGGRLARYKVPADAVRDGMGFIPGDREREGVFGVRTVAENLLAADHGAANPLAYLSAAKTARRASELAAALQVVSAGIQAPASSLSGGNQQKLVVGRWLAMNARILLLDDPTKGVDISSRREIHDLLRGLATKGAAMLFASSDLEELKEISDRIVVFLDGKVVANLARCDATDEALAAAMHGAAGKKEAAE